MENMLELWLLGMLLLSASVWFDTFTKLFCLLNYVLHAENQIGKTSTNWEIVEQRPLYHYCKALSSDAICLGKDVFSALPHWHPKANIQPLKPTALASRKQWCKEKYPSDVLQQFWITTCMSFQEMKRSYWATSYLPQNSELNWKYHTGWKQKSWNSWNWNQWWMYLLLFSMQTLTDKDDSLNYYQNKL